VERFRIDYNAAGDITATSNATSGISSITVTDAVGGLIEVTLDNTVYNLPFAQLSFFGYDQINDRYVVTSLTDNNTTRFLDGDSGNLFDGSGTVVMDLLANKASSFSSANFGQPTHAYVQMTCTTV
jgi:hypothetical protein